MPRSFKKERTSLWRRRVGKWLFAKQNGICHWCREPMNLTPDDPKMCTIDHVVALADGGSNAESNLVGAHKSCNAKRGSNAMREHNRVQTEAKRKRLAEAKASDDCPS